MRQDAKYPANSALSTPHLLHNLLRQSEARPITSGEEGMNRCVTTFALVLLAGNSALAQQPMGPPQDAFDACSGGSNGSSCSFDAPRGNITGTCGTLPGQSSGQLVCMPARKPGGSGDAGEQSSMPMQRGQQGARTGTPPQEAINACSAGNEGNACSFQGMRGETVSGSCRSVGEQLACVPSGGRPPMQ